MRGKSYPEEFEDEVTLCDGVQLRIRPIVPEDDHRLVALSGRLSRHTAYQRFFTVMKQLPPDQAAFLAQVDYRERLALVAERSGADASELIGVARYDAGEDPPEVALVVQDDWQGRGLGTILLKGILSASLSLLTPGGVSSGLGGATAPSTVGDRTGGSDFPASVPVTPFLHSLSAWPSE